MATTENNSTITFHNIKRRYAIITEHIRNPRAPALTDEEKMLLDAYAPIDIHGWLIAEVERLRAFISRVHNHSCDPAAVLIAGEVLNGHDVREKEI